MYKKIVIFSFIAVFSFEVNATIHPIAFSEIKLGYQLASDENYDDSAPQNVFFGLNGGIRAEEWEWYVGFQSHAELYASSTDVRVNTQLLESGLTYNWELGSNIGMYTTMGLSYWDIEKSTINGKIEAKGFSPVIELGTKYKINENVFLSLGYQYIDSLGKNNTGEYDSHSVVTGVRYEFNNYTPQNVSFEDKGIKNFTTDFKEVEKSDDTNCNNTNIKFTLPESEAFFDTGKFNIKPSLQPLIKDISLVIKKYPLSNIRIVGHTDSVGSNEYNQKLSELRAQSIANVLFSLGVSREKMLIIGKGESMPIADNTTAFGRKQNRRVNITIMLVNPTLNEECDIFSPKHK